MVFADGINQQYFTAMAAVRTFRPIGDEILLRRQRHRECPVVSFGDPRPSALPPVHNVSYEWPKDDVALQDGQNIDKAFAETLVWMKHNITMFAAKCRMLGDCHLLFC